jgi:hypothetical protein
VDAPTIEFHALLTHGRAVLVAVFLLFFIVNEGGCSHLSNPFVQSRPQSPAEIFQKVSPSALDTDDLVRRFESIPLPIEVKEDLWELKFGSRVRQ